MNKIIIPAAMLAVGVALVGSVSSTLAWYQYSTKAQAAFIGTSVGESENLEIKTADLDGNSQPIWKSSLSSADVNKLIANYNSLNIIPITPAVTEQAPDFAQTSALLNSGFYSGIETGVAGYGTNPRKANANNYVQFKLNVRYKKTSNSDTYAEKLLKLIDLTIVDNAGPKANPSDTEGTQLDLYKAVRVHISAGTNYSLFARDSLTAIDSSDANNATRATVRTDTFGNLDTNNSGENDKALAYEWETNNNYVMYGFNGQQTAYNAAYGSLNTTIGTIPADEEDGLELTVTLWLEGWQKLSSGTANDSAMWDPAVYVNKQFKVGFRFQADDVPQNP